MIPTGFAVNRGNRKASRSAWFINPFFGQDGVALFPGREIRPHSLGCQEVRLCQKEAEVVSLFLIDPPG